MTPTYEQLMAASKQQILDWLEGTDPEASEAAEPHKEYRVALEAYGEECVEKALNGPGSNPPSPPPPPPGI